MINRIRKIIPVILVTTVVVSLGYSKLACSESTAKVVGHFNETLSESVPVSGNVIAGMNINGQKNEDFLPFILVDKPLNSMVCVSVLSQDGLYVSRNTYELTQENNGVVFLDYKTKHASSLMDKELALKVSVGACDAVLNKNKLLVSGYGQHNDEQVFNLYIDSLGATDIALAVKSKDKNEVTRAYCEQIRSGKRVGFDFKCQLSFATIQNGAEARLLRKRNGRVIGTDRFEIN